MNPTLRRILLIVAFALIVIGFFFVIWLVFFKAGPVANVNNGNVGNINGLPGIGNGNINGQPTGNVNILPIVNGLPEGQQPSNVAQGGPTYTETVVTASSSALIASTSSDLRFYNRETGQFFKIAPDGSAQTLLTDDIYRDVQDIDWSFDGSKAILTFPDGAKILYDFSTKRQTTLPRELNEFSFSQDSDQIVSKFLNGANADDQWLMVSNPDGSQAEAVEHLGANADGVTTAWSPNNQIIAMYQKSASTNLSEIIFLGAQGENFQSATIEGRGFIPKWSPDGRKVLYSSYSEFTNNNPHLYLMNGSPDALGTGHVDLGLDTRADKCTFSSSGLALYCAVPYYLNPGSGPQPELSAGIPDNIYRIDLLRGSAELIARPIDQNLNQRFSASSLQLTPTEDALYFIDQNTGAIQRISLR